MGESFLKDALQYIVWNAQPRWFTDKNNNEWCNERLFQVMPKEDEPTQTVEVNTLSGLVDLVKNEGVHVGGKLFVHVANERTVRVYSEFSEGKNTRFLRYGLYQAVADLPRITVGRPMSQEQAIVELQSLYGVTEDRTYLLDLISRISIEDGVTSCDNGVTQEVTARSGVALKEQTQVKPIVELQPYRTFLEVVQPISNFLLRVGKNGVTLHEADGGVWRLLAKSITATYLKELLDTEIEAGKVVVMV